MNPICPKCGRFMKIEKRLVESRTLPTGHKTYGLIKFWVCPNKSVLHGLIKYRVGSQVIPHIKKENK